MAPCSLHLSSVACVALALLASDETKITAADLRAHVEYLASDELGGRPTGGEGGEVAARYLAAALERAGVEPAGDDGFLQRVDLVRRVVQAPPALVVDRGGTTESLVWGADFDVDVRASGTEWLDVVRVARADDIPAEPGAGTALFFDTSSKNVRQWSEAYGEARLERFGLLVRKGSMKRRKERERRLPRPRLALDGPHPSAWVRANGPLLEGLREGSVDRLRLESHVERETLVAYNVVGRLPGRGRDDDPGLARQAVVFSAHYDHLGTREVAEGEDGIYNGADDNASGTAAVLELAEAYAAGDAPARTLVFLLVTGEEQGLLGTQAYLERPAAPLADTVYNINFEMIGRPDATIGGTGEQWLVGWELTNVGPAMKQDGCRVHADPYPDKRFFYRSDHMAFVRRGVVGQSLSSYNLHEDYHRPSDEAAKLDYAHMQAVVREAYRALAPIVDGRLLPTWNEGVEFAKEAR